VRRREAEGRYPDRISGQVLNGPIVLFERNGIGFSSISAVHKSGGGSVRFVARGGDHAFCDDIEATCNSTWPVPMPDSM
jgi:hypothetical protein